MTVIEITKVNCPFDNVKSLKITDSKKRVLVNIKNLEFDEKGFIILPTPISVKNKKDLIFHFD